MTKKRFINNIDKEQLIDTKGELSTINYSDTVDFYELWEFLNKLNDENEQLKQRNDRQYNQLKQLWELIEDENYNTLRSMLNQRETDEKLLQKEWGTYSV